MVIPLEDKYSVSRNELLDQLAYALGGRVAEELVFHDPTTGAGSDIEKATATARKMVTDYGMSSAVGPSSSARAEARRVHGRFWPVARLLLRASLCRSTPRCARSLEQAHNEAYELLNANRDVLDFLAKELLEKETPRPQPACRDLPRREEAEAPPDVALARRPSGLAASTDRGPRRRPHRRPDGREGRAGRELRTGSDRTDPRSTTE